MTIKQKQLSIFYLCLIGFFGIFSTTISKNPVLPLFAKDLGASISLLGLLSALSPLAGILFSFPIGFLADKWGKKRLLIISSLIFVSAPLLYLLVTNPWMLIPIRFFHGLATAILGPIAAAIICDVYNEKKAQNLGVYSSSTLVGRMIAPILGGFLISYFAIYGGFVNYKVVYIIAFIASLPTLIFALLTKNNFENHFENDISFKGLVSTLKDFKNNELIFLTSLIEMSTYFIYGVFETFLPIHLVEKGISASKIGIIFSIQVLSIAATKPFLGKIADRIDKRIQIVVGVLLISTSNMLITTTSDYSTIVLLSVIFGLGMSTSTIATSTYIADLSAKKNLGSNLGALSSMMDVGQTLGPFIIGFVITSFSVNTGFFVSSILAFIVAILFIKTFIKNKQLT